LIALLAEPRDVNAPDLLGTPALHWLVERGDLEGVKLLLDKGADPNRLSRQEVLPLSVAAANGDAAMIRLLVEAGADPQADDAAGGTMLMAAVTSGELEAVEALLALGAAPDALEESYEQTALMFAARLGHTAIARALLAAGATVDARTRVGPEPRWVLPNSREGFGFGIGIIRGGLPADRGMRPFRSGGMTPLLYAAREGYADTVALLLDAGADIEGVDANDITPLLMATLNDRMAAATLLVERGANLDHQDWYGRSPLWAAVEMRNIYLHNQTFEHHVDRGPVLELIELMLAKGADP